MKQFCTPYGHASMAILAQQIQRMDIWEEVGQRLHVRQKTVTLLPVYMGDGDKLTCQSMESAQEQDNPYMLR